MVASQQGKIDAAIGRAHTKREARLAKEAGPVVSVVDIMPPRPTPESAPRPTPESAPRRLSARGRLATLGRTIGVGTISNRGNADASAPAQPAVVEVLPDAPPEMAAAPPEPAPVVVATDAPMSVAPSGTTPQSDLKAAIKAAAEAGREDFKSVFAQFHRNPYTTAQILSAVDDYYDEEALP